VVQPTLDWPLRLSAQASDPDYHGISNCVDRNPAYPNQILDYNCGARSDDTSGGHNHQGVDCFTWPFGWLKMSQKTVEIIAAVPGRIIYKADGNFDQSCGFNNNPWNAVYLEHDDGSIAWYGHMKNGSLTTKVVGDRVARGEYLGAVGSSGNSSGPHLHMELYDAAGALADPHAGSCNALAKVWWKSQRRDADSAINQVTTGGAAASFVTWKYSTTFQGKTFDRYFNFGGTMTVKVKVPNGGEVYALGATVPVKWSSNIGGQLRVELWRQGAFVNTLFNATPNDGKQNWMIPAGTAPGNYKIRVIDLADETVLDDSNRTFQIQ
jgi:murein DD-endopeptidase MepM/ murein hydrolase activator NlpD